MLTADVSRGTANDYSAFMVFDITEIPYRVVAKFRDNEIKPLLFPTKIHEVAKAYNEAYVMVEVNDIGEQVANTLQFDLEYDNLVGFHAWQKFVILERSLEVERNWE